MSIDPTEIRTGNRTALAAIRKRRKTPPVMLWIGAALILAGVLAFGYFFTAYDTTVPSSNGGRIHNIGLLQNRNLGCAGALAAVVVGAVLLAVGVRK